MARSLLFGVCMAWVSPVGAQAAVREAVHTPAVGKDTARLVAIGGAVTEIVCALGAGAQLVGVDTSSTYPEAVRQFPQVGYQRTLAAEGVLSLQPDLVLTTAEAGPPAALAQLHTAGVPVLLVPVAYTLEGVRERIELVARALGREAQGARLWQSVQDDMAHTRALLARLPSRPTVLFIYARGRGALNVSGRGTSAAAMIELAGGINAVTGYEGYKPLTAEAVVTAAPEVILMPTRGMESIGGAEGLLQVPGLGLTPAAQRQRIVAMDDLYLLGFGPRVGQAVRELAALLHPALQGHRP